MKGQVQIMKGLKNIFEDGGLAMGYFSKKDAERREEQSYEGFCINCGGTNVSVTRPTLGKTIIYCGDCEYENEIVTTMDDTAPIWGTGSQTIACNETVEFSVDMTDTHAIFNEKTNEITIPADGYYELYGTFKLGAGDVLEIKSLKDHKRIKKL